MPSGWVQHSVTYIFLSMTIKRVLMNCISLIPLAIQLDVADILFFSKNIRHQHGWLSRALINNTILQQMTMKRQKLPVVSTVLSETLLFSHGRYCAGMVILPHQSQVSKVRLQQKITSQGLLSLTSSATTALQSCKTNQYFLVRCQMYQFKQPRNFTEFKKNIFPAINKGENPNHCATCYEADLPQKKSFTHDNISSNKKLQQNSVFS